MREGAHLASAVVLTSPAIETSLAGLLFGLSLIVAVGAQNAYVLRQGLLRQHLLTVVGICTLSDAVLIAAGVAGAGAVLHGRPWLLQTARVGGAAFLFGYAALAAWRALRPPPIADENTDRPSGLPSVVAACLAFTWLNPAVYLDTLLLLGSVANTHHGDQWWFGGGAAMASALWFVGLGFGARLLIPVFRTRVAWRALDGFVALVMATTGLRILLAG
jgi:L-lysine exporter family protein LysE/ArgO